MVWWAGVKAGKTSTKPLTADEYAARVARHRKIAEEHFGRQVTPEES